MRSWATNFLHCLPYLLQRNKVLPSFSPSRSLYGLLALLIDIGFLGLTDSTRSQHRFKQKQTPGLEISSMAQTPNASMSTNAIWRVTQRKCQVTHMLHSTCDVPALFRVLNLTAPRSCTKLSATSTRPVVVLTWPITTPVPAIAWVLERMIRNETVLPHKTGVKLIVGAPSLSKNQV